jgi:4-hydroxy-tetrahydrodipicolinate synthase
MKPKTATKLTASTLHGIWAGVTMAWDEQFGFNEAVYEANVRRTVKAGVHGVYTTGSTGEFYAIDEDEFVRMVDIQARVCGEAGVPLQIGCCADSTAKVLRLMEIANRPEVGAVQVVLPYWMELSDREVLQFFGDLYRAFPDLPLVHYNIPRAKRFLGGEDYKKILDVAPSLIGVKFTYAGANFAKLQNALLATPQLSYFVGENLLVSAMQLGARGTYSSMIFTNPRIMLDLYAAAEAKEWGVALQMQAKVTRFMNDVEGFIESTGEGLQDPVFDKGLALASGCLQGHQRCRAPYIGWSDETVSKLRAWMKDRYPEFLFPESK